MPGGGELIDRIGGLEGGPARQVAGAAQASELVSGTQGVPDPLANAAGTSLSVTIAGSVMTALSPF